MADLKPLGSEKLQGDEKLKRILELTYYNPDKKSDKKSVDAEYLSESINGVYGIVKEKDGYYVKKGLTESTLDYIGGMFMKNKNRFNSYAEALKRLELLKGQELLLQEDTKYMLRVNKGKSAPKSADEGIPPAPVTTDMAPADAGVPGSIPGAPPTDIPPDDASAEEAPEDVTGLEDEEGGDFLKGIQKLTGKLGEKLRDHMDEMESDDLKYVLNSVISAIDLKKMDDSDKDEVVSQLEGEEETGDENLSGEIPAPEAGTEPPIPPTDEKELGEVDALEELINTPFDFNDDEDKPYEELDEILPPEEINGDAEEISPEDNFDSDEELPELEPEPESSDEESEVCVDCHGTGMIKGRECPTCHGEGVVYNDNEEAPKNIEDIKGLTAADLYDEDPEYDPTEMGEEYTAEEVFDGPDSGDVKMKEIELNELTDMINNTVKETLGKYFE